MSEECTDYYDCRVEASKLLKPGSTVHVEVTRQAAARLLERRPREYKKLDLKVVEDIVRNVVRDGLYKAFSDKVVIWTKKYALICTFDREERLVVKTVVAGLSIGDRLKKVLERRGKRIKWNRIFVEIPPQSEA